MSLNGIVDTIDVIIEFVCHLSVPNVIKYLLGESYTIGPITLFHYYYYIYCLKKSKILILPEFSSQHFCDFSNMALLESQRVAGSDGDNDMCPQTSHKKRNIEFKFKTNGNWKTTPKKVASAKRKLPHANRFELNFKF